MLQALEPRERTAIEASVREAKVYADSVLPHLREVVASAGAGARLTGVDKRCKTASALARSYLAESEFDAVRLETFLMATKDRVRFAVQVDEAGYERTVRSVLDALGRLGFTIPRIVNFWHGGGRHNGLNVTVHDPDGIGFELQFPTGLSWSISKDTYRWYQIVRLPGAPYAVRVDAFLRILAVNKARNIAGHLPADWEVLHPTKTVDSTFARWIADTEPLWQRYLDDLRREGMTFDHILDRHHLSRTEILPSGISGQGGDHDGDRLSDGPGR